MQSSNKSATLFAPHLPRRQMLFMGSAVAGMLMVPSVFAQSIDARHWQGTAAVTRQPEHIVATTMAEWRSLWSRVGSPPPDMFEAGRMNAVGIFLGRRGGEGYAVNILSTARRRDRIVVVFEERMPAEMMMAQRAAPRPVAVGPLAGGPPPSAPSALPPGASGFAAPGGSATLAPPPPAARPVGQPTSPWAIILINRADLPVSVEQRLFR